MFDVQSNRTAQKRLKIVELLDFHSFLFTNRVIQIIQMNQCGLVCRLIRLIKRENCQRFTMYYNHLSRIKCLVRERDVYGVI